MAAQNNGKLTVFYCYAREDENLRKELDKHLRTFKRNHSFDSWFDGEIVECFTAFAGHYRGNRV